MTDASVATISIETKDHKVHKVPRNVAELSMTIKNLLGEVEATADTPVPINAVDGPTMEKVLAWCTYHHAHPSPPLQEADKFRTDNIPKWDVDFFDVPKGLFFDIILAANYLDIKELLENACKHLANMMKGKNLDEIKKEFTMPPEEIARRQAQP